MAIIDRMSTFELHALMCRLAVQYADEYRSANTVAEYDKAETIRQYWETVANRYREVISFITATNHVSLD